MSARRLPSIICGLALACLLPAQQPPAPPAQTQPASPTAGPFNLNNVSLLEVINELTRELHINYVLDASIKRRWQRHRQYLRNHTGCRPASSARDHSAHE